MNTKDNQINRNYINDIDKKNESFNINSDYSMNLTQNTTNIDITQNSMITNKDNISFLEKEEEKVMISDELRQNIEKIMDEKFEELIAKINNEFEEKMEALIDEQEEIHNKKMINEAKFYTLERYLKNYCKKANIDYDSL